MLAHHQLRVRFHLAQVETRAKSVDKIVMDGLGYTSAAHDRQHARYLEHPHSLCDIYPEENVARE